MALLRALRTTAIILLISAVLLELIGAAHYWFSHSQWFYARQPSGPVSTPTQPGHSESKLVLHPYLGFIRRPSIPVSRIVPDQRLAKMVPGTTSKPNWMKLAANNHGFFSDTDYPVNKNDQNEFIIGIFGGSVAQWFALQSSERLAQLLKNGAGFEGKKIRILNFAQGGFKQPQQLQALSYFLAKQQPFDLVINIAGFNEVAMGAINLERNVSPAMPSSQQMLPLIALASSASADTQSLKEVLEVLQQQRLVNRVSYWEANTPSAGIYLILTQLLPVVQNRLHASQVKSQGAATNDTHTLYPLEPASAENMDVLANWAGASMTMQELARANGIPYLELVQPNQYAPGRNMTPEERAIAIKQNSPYLNPVERYYPLLPDWINQQQASGLNIHSLINAFDFEHETVYSDTCCHYNQHGNDLLAKLIAERVRETLNSNQSKLH
ncbi:MAG: hypothetical protein ACWA5Q_00805 [bacterium]